MNRNHSKIYPHAPAICVNEAVRSFQECFGVAAKNLCVQLYNWALALISSWSPVINLHFLGLWLLSPSPIGPFKLYISFLVVGFGPPSHAVKDIIFVLHVNKTLANFTFTGWFSPLSPPKAGNFGTTQIQSGHHGERLQALCRVELKRTEPNINGGELLHAMLACKMGLYQLWMGL